MHMQDGLTSLGFNPFAITLVAREGMSATARTWNSPTGAAGDARPSEAALFDGSIQPKPMRLSASDGPFKFGNARSSLTLCCICNILES